MNNLLIIGDGFSSKTYIVELEYLLNEKFDSIYLLRETNRCDDIFIGCTCPINVVNDIDTGLSNCHTVFVMCSVRFTEDMFEKHLRSHNLYDKRVYKINIANTTECQCNNSSAILHHNSTPTILVLNSSSHTQSHVIELSLNKYFVEEGLNLFQKFSENSFRILHQLKQESLLNPVVCNTLCDSKHTNLAIKAIDLFDNYTYTDIANINPVYTILVTEAAIPQTVDNIYNTFYARYGLTLNAIVKSQFVSVKLWNTRTDLLYKGNMAIYFAHENTSPSHTAVLSALLDDLVSSISLPDNIDRIELKTNI